MDSPFVDRVGLPPSVEMVQMLGGFQISQALYVVSVLGVPDQLVGGPRRIQELADAVGAQPDPLRRLLRTLASLGVFHQIDDETFDLTALGDTLTSSSPASVRDVALTWMETHYAPFGLLLDTARTGQPAAESFYGEAFFTWLHGHPEHVHQFTRAMRAMTQSVWADVIRSVDLGGMRRVVDVGGADAMVLILALANWPDARGIVFDQPQVVGASEKNLRLHGMEDRVDIVGGDFFDSVPAGDGYLLSRVLHDWADPACIRILANIRAAAEPGAQLRVLESVVPPGPEPHLAKLMDLTMLAMVTGKERSEAQWTALLETAGFRLDRIVTTSTAMSVLEASAT